MAELTTPQRKAITALLTERTRAEAAKVAGVGERTLYRWLQEDDEFKAALSLEEAEVFSDASRRLSGLLGRSIDELSKLLDSDMQPVDKIRTIRTILASAPRLREISSLEARIQELETLIAGLQTDKKKQFIPMKAR
jgi:hypothetical protein